MSAMEKALLKATAAKPQKGGEDRQKFLLRLMLAVQKLPDEDWESLAAIEGAQDWFNAATDADNAEKPVPDFPDAEADAEADAEEDEDQGEQEDEDNQEEDEMAKTAKKAKPPAKGASAKKEPAAKPAKAAAKGADVKKPAKDAEKKKPGAAPKKGLSMRRFLKQMVVKKPSRTVEDLMEALEKAGYKSPSRLTITTIRADTRDTIRVLNEAGLTEVTISDGRAGA